MAPPTTFSSLDPGPSDPGVASVPHPTSGAPPWRSPRLGSASMQLHLSHKTCQDGSAGF